MMCRHSFEVVPPRWPEHNVLVPCKKYCDFILLIAMHYLCLYELGSPETLFCFVPHQPLLMERTAYRPHGSAWRHTCSRHAGQG
jgi:hypothetical protein